MYFHSEEESTRYFSTCKICVLISFSFSLFLFSQVMKSCPYWYAEKVGNVWNRWKGKQNLSLFANKILGCLCQKMCHKRKNISKWTHRTCFFLSSFIFIVQFLFTVTVTTFSFSKLWRFDVSSEFCIFNICARSKNKMAALLKIYSSFSVVVFIFILFISFRWN